MAWWLTPHLAHSGILYGLRFVSRLLHFTCVEDLEDAPGFRSAQLWVLGPLGVWRGEQVISEVLGSLPPIWET